MGGCKFKAGVLNHGSMVNFDGLGPNRISSERIRTVSLLVNQAFVGDFNM